MKMQKIRDMWDDNARNIDAREQVRLLGAPDDRGVLNVGGRLGAAQGPSALREFLGQMQRGIAAIRFDAGHDAETGDSIEAAHESLRKGVRDGLAAGDFPLVIGGGHDFGFPHLAGARDHFNEDLAVINVDAHLDVRPPSEKGITSGSPFFLAIESGALNPERFYEFGIQEHCNSEEGVAYLERKGARILFLGDLREAKGGVVGEFGRLLGKLERAKRKTVVSFDLDAVSLAWAPGVSAPQADGLSAQEFLQLVRLCAKSASVRTVGFFEFAPPLDENSKTARLLATAIHQFVSGFARRSSCASRTAQRAAKRPPRRSSRAGRDRQGSRGF